GGRGGVRQGAARELRGKRRGRRRSARDGHRAGPGCPQAARPRGHRRGPDRPCRAERGIRLSEPGRDPRARARPGPRQRQRRRDRDRSSARDERCPPRRHVAARAPAPRGPLRAGHALRRRRPGPGSAVRAAMTPADESHLLAAIELARRAREHGNNPFGALLVDADGNIVLEVENTVVTDRDVTAHAELSLMRQAGARLASDSLAGCTLYASTEPCAMCAGAIYWGNVRRVV